MDKTLWEFIRHHRHAAKGIGARALPLQVTSEVMPDCAGNRKYSCSAEREERLAWCFCTAPREHLPHSVA